MLKFQAAIENAAFYCVVTFVGATFILGACHTFRANVAPIVRDAVKAYCDTPPAARDAAREEIERAIAPNKITVTCTSR